LQVGEGISTALRAEVSASGFDLMAGAAPSSSSKHRTSLFYELSSIASSPTCPHQQPSTTVLLVKSGREVNGGTAPTRAS
jgi:hypothetical protein